MRTLNRVHSFSPAAFIFKAEPSTPAPTLANMTTAFQANAYAMGQWCLPYSVPVRRMRFANSRSAS